MAFPLLYLSVPTIVDINCVKELIKCYLSNDVEFDYWYRGTNYDNNWVKHSDGIVIFHPTNNCSFHVSELPSGVQKELKQAIDNQLPVYTAYQRSSDKVWGIYETTLINARNMEMLQIHSGSRRHTFPKKKQEQEKSIKEKLSSLENKVQKMDAQSEIAVSENIILLYGA